MNNDRLVVVREKNESTIVKLAKIIALVATSPLIFIGAIFAIVAVMTVVVVLIGSGTSVFHSIAPWLLFTVLLFSLLPAVRERVSGKTQIKALKAQIQQLELDLSEARLEALKHHETAEFHKKLNASQPVSSKPDSIKLQQPAKDRS